MVRLELLIEASPRGPHTITLLCNQHPSEHSLSRLNVIYWLKDSTQLSARAYIQLMRPQLEYACTAWDAGLTKTQTSDLENVQRRAARMVRSIPRSDWHLLASSMIYVGRIFLTGEKCGT